MADVQTNRLFALSTASVGLDKNSSANGNTCQLKTVILGTRTVTIPLLIIFMAMAREDFLC